MKSRLFAAPYMVWMLLFTVIPLLFIFYFAFFGSDNTFTWSGFAYLADPVMIKTFIYSLWIALATTAICLVAAYPLAFIISRRSGASQRTMIMLIMIPMWMNFLLRIYAWVMLLENRGLVNGFLGLLGFGPAHMMGTNGAVLVVMVYNYLPFMVLPLYSVMVKIDKSLIEASNDLGCNGKGVLRRILLPLSMPGVLAGILMVFVPAASTFVIAQEMQAPPMVGDVIESFFLGSGSNFAIGSAMSLVLMFIILICMLFMSKADNDDMEGIIV